MTKRKISLSLLVAIFASTLLTMATPVHAATLTFISDTLDNNQKSATGVKHSIVFNQQTSISFGQTIVVAPTSWPTLGGVTNASISLTFGATTGLETTATLAASASAGVWGVANTAGNFTITAPPSGATLPAANDFVRITINAVAAVANPATAGNYTWAITSGSDSQTILVAILDHGAVNVTSTVAETLTVSDLTGTSLTFGTLNSSAPQYADASGSSSDVTGTTFSVSTNAAHGYSTSVRGATLTSSASGYTINAASGASSVPGSEQFGIKVVVTDGADAGTGSAAVSAPYSGSLYTLTSTSNSATPIASATAATVTNDYAIHYIANISPVTEMGTYSTTLYYVTTGSF